ncbi:MAG: hypothetical protein LBT37_01725 [Lactobacillaceae bacterium]|jgi:hypothetical protein|nr:hypothetical protein [Lactobacillaceae bacterium]
MRIRDKQLNSKSLSGLFAIGASVAFLSAPVQADTYSNGSWTSGDGETEITTTIDPSYTVTIPSTITLPQSDSYTNETANVYVSAGSTIAKNQIINVNLSADQTFAVEHTGAASDQVPFKVKINAGTGIASTPVAVNVLSVNADDAHDLTSSANLNVGFDTGSAPDFKYAGNYYGSINFDVSTSALVTAEEPVVGGTVNLNSNTMNVVKKVSNAGKNYYLVIEAGQGTQAQYNNGANYGSYNSSALKTAIDAQATSVVTSNTGTQNVVAPEGYKIHSTVLRGSDNGSAGSILNWASADFQNAFCSIPLDSGVTAGASDTVAYAFVPSFADLQGASAGTSFTFSGQINVLASDVTNVAKTDVNTWLRSPGHSNVGAAALTSTGTLTGIHVSYNQAARMAFWISK